MTSTQADSYQLVVRWFLKKHGKLPKNVPKIHCAHCGKRPPDRTEFMDMGDRVFHCHVCLRAAMADSEIGKE
jgi:hypothetical protein